MAGGVGGGGIIDLTTAALTASVSPLASASRYAAAAERIAATSTGEPRDSPGWARAIGMVAAAIAEATRSPMAVEKTLCPRTTPLGIGPVVGMGEAFRIAKLEMAQDIAKAKHLSQRLLNGLKDIEQVFINGHLTQRVPHNLNISFNYVEGESLIMGIKGLAVSSGSACTSASLEPSYVLRALGRSDELAHSSLRMTVGRFSTEEEIDYAIATIRTNVSKLRDLSPLWDMYKEGIDISTIQWAAH